MRCEQVQGSLEYSTLSGPAYVRREYCPSHARGSQHIPSSPLFMSLPFYLHSSSSSKKSSSNSTDIRSNS
jgi:hypothetical protein